MPSRLIEIHTDTTGHKLKLIATDSDQPKPYATSSYCWGGNQPLQSAKALVHLWMTDIPWQRLPKTLQDAITVCSPLGIFSLWVDCFCIIQDDETDKAIQIARMPDIYQSSALTIAAVCAASVLDGFLDERRATNVLEQAFELPVVCHNGEMGSITLIKAINYHKPEPLDLRGWTLQERLLSTRILEFGRKTISWTCKSGKQVLSDAWNDKLVDGNYQLDKLHKQFDKLSAVRRRDGREHFQTAMRYWNDLLEVYTKRKLSVPTDRIMAISGIAQRYGAACGGEYLAGLWKDALPNALLWGREGEMRSRPEQWQGPSWSWTSIN
ncbi:heterokaryon incompatibility protein-domain-containing protein, partial [Lasiosphaeria miniovina]